MNTSKAGGKSDYEALAGLNALTLKEKCLYLIKISKRNTSDQTLVVTGLTFLVMTVGYLLV